MKGGVCKTTTTRNMGYILATVYNKKVLLIDLDSSGNLSSAFDVKPAEDPITKKPVDTIGSSCILVDKDANPLDHIKETRVPNLYVMPGDKTLGAAEVAIKLDVSYPQQFRLSQQLKKINDQFDYCLIDCPPTIENSITVINALQACDNVLIPTTPNADALNGIYSVKSMVDTVSDFNPKIMIRGALLCRVARNAYCRALVNDSIIENTYGIPCFNTFIRESVKAEYSLLNGRVFCEEDKHSKPALDYDNFTAEFLGEPLPHPNETYTTM
jgi:chromosome partitioning protein